MNFHVMLDQNIGLLIKLLCEHPLLVVTANDASLTSQLSQIMLTKIRIGHKYANNLNNQETIMQIITVTVSRDPSRIT